MTWWLKIPVKLVLSRAPVSYRLWKAIGLFQHGSMNSPKAALDTLVEHATTAQVLIGDATPQFACRHDFCVLELGPGDSLFTGIIAHHMGATKSWLVDSGSYATRDFSLYKQLLDLLAARGLSRTVDASNLPSLLADCGVAYLTKGLTSLRHPTASVDFVFSNAVLEHIPLSDFAGVMTELRRVSKRSAVAVHRVDLRDHLGGRLNNLRFPEWLWESKWFREGGFYTNRIRFTEMLRQFETAGFVLSIPRKVSWDHLPTPRRVMNTHYRHLSEE